jgi:hypothetical protein
MSFDSKYTGEEIEQKLDRVQPIMYGAKALEKEDWDDYKGECFSATIYDERITDGCLITACASRETQDIADAAGIYSQIMASDGYFQLFAKRNPGPGNDVVIQYSIQS